MSKLDLGQLEKFYSLFCNAKLYSMEYEEIMHMMPNIITALRTAVVLADAADKCVDQHQLPGDVDFEQYVAAVESFRKVMGQ